MKNIFIKSMVNKRVVFWILLIGHIFVVPAKADVVEDAAESSWKKVSQKAQASVWTRDVKGSSIREVKLEVLFDAPVQQIWKTNRQFTQATNKERLMIQAAAATRPATSPPSRHT